MSLLILLIVFSSFQIAKAQQEKSSERLIYNAELAAELSKMAEIDQIAANKPKGEYAKLSEEEFEAFQDSVYRTHEKRLRKIIEQYGFPGYDRVGKEGSADFWRMVQHSDHDPAFQKLVLDKMLPEVKNNNAEAEKYGYLVDRVNLNTGKPQLYGTQLAYRSNTGQPYPRNLSDSSNVNKRRMELGMEPLEDYLNKISKFHYQMNRQRYMQQGITGPTLYPQGAFSGASTEDNHGTFITQSLNDTLAKRIRNYLTSEYLTANDLEIITQEQRKFQLFQIDLNNDGEKEVFVNFITPYFCGSGGCTILLL
ncbi:DUF6624 domain-containing protein, partial [Longispora fulva]|uniref:DUF6624 domain-containing protein n=1 Tax=Longispora fulva TaxID=619741 RepID=UPI00362CB5CA